MNSAKPSCDCGRPADRRDGSGWSCSECRAVVSSLQAWLDRYIIATRAEERMRELLASGDKHQKQLAYNRKYYAANRQRRRAQHLIWTRKNRRQSTLPFHPWSRMMRPALTTGH